MADDKQTLLERPAHGAATPVELDHTALAVGTPPGDAMSPLPTDMPARIGRFAILRKLGAGGMGVVYAAYDSELDRKVAVKLVRTELSDRNPEATRKAMQREARAMARVEHPSVITVYEVGTVDEQLFVAMELVAGGDLRGYLVAKPRGWRDVLATCIQAGRGLAAAHSAGLVHRDFKPDNVLVGDDGRVRVTDFGLARQVIELDEVTGQPRRLTPDPALRLTRTGALVGTPAYMAPEQHRGEPADARSDQFAFCVTTWEALYGERPFAGTNYTELALNVTDGNLRDAPRSAVPARIRTALARGLSVDPAARFASMDELLAALAIDRTRWLWIAAAGVGLALAVATTWAFTRESPSTGCPSATSKLASIWDPASRSAVTRALTAAAPFGADISRHVTAQLDSYAARWSESWNQTCRDNREQSRGMFDLRVACLGQRLHALEAVTRTFLSADSTIALNAAATVRQLEDIAPCDNPGQLLKSAPPANVVAELDNLDVHMRAAESLRLHGMFAEAQQISESLVAAAAKLGARAYAARTLLFSANLHTDAAEFAKAEQTLQRATSEALAAGDDELAGKGFVMLVDTIGYDLGRPAEAHRLADLARGAIERAGNPPDLELDLLNALSRVLLLEGKHDEALVQLDRALALEEQKPAERIYELSGTLSAKTQVLFDLGRFDEARKLNARELEVRAKITGTHHPSYATALATRANLHMVANEWAAAIADLRQGRQIITDGLGDSSPELAQFENNLGVIAGELGDWTEALRAGRIALALAEKAGGPEHPDSAKARANVGSALTELGRFDEAERELEAARALQEKVLGAQHQDHGITLQHVGELRLAQGRGSDAITMFERAKAVLDKALGADNPQLTYVTSGLGRAQLIAGDARKARQTLTAAEQTIAAGGVDPVLLAHTRLALADALWQTGDRAAAQTMAAQVEPALAPLPASSNQPLRDELAKWRAKHPKS